MPRSARTRSETGVYHVMVRGINRQDIFLDNSDRTKYLETLDKVKARSGCLIHGYCLMNNHIHLLMAEGSEGIGPTMKRLGSAYVFWYNHKYDRVGHLFQDRFLSEPINNEAYLLTALRYIHQNPVKAGIASDCGRYEWSSFLPYIGGTEFPPRLTDVALALEMVGGKQRFVEFHKTLSSDELMDTDKSDRSSDTDASRMIQSALDGRSATDLMAMEAAERTKLLRELKALPGVSLRQIARLTGLDRNIIQRLSGTP